MQPNERVSDAHLSSLQHLPFVENLHGEYLVGVSHFNNCNLREGQCWRVKKNCVNHTCDSKASQRMWSMLKHRRKPDLISLKQQEECESCMMIINELSYFIVPQTTHNLESKREKKWLITMINVPYKIMMNNFSHDFPSLKRLCCSRTIRDRAKRRNRIR